METPLFDELPDPPEETTTTNPADTTSNAERTANANRTQEAGRKGEDPEGSNGGTVEPEPDPDVGES